MITVVFKSKPAGLAYSTNEDPMVFFAGSRSYRQNPNNRSWRPATDIYENEDKVIVLVEIAGMKEEDFSITMDRNILYIQGTRLYQIEDPRAIHQMEIPFGEFTVELIFPMEVKHENVSATYFNGFLKIVLPKALPKRIELNRE